MCNPLQMGVLASAALVGLDDATERMRVDHEHAKALAKGVGDSLCPKRSSNNWEIMGPSGVYEFYILYYAESPSL